MIFKNTAGQGVYLYATTSSGAPDTGDSANITVTISKDGGAASATATAHPTEIGAGAYWLPLAQAETNANAIFIAASSATSGVRLAPVIVYTNGGTMNLAAPGAANGLITVGTTVAANVVQVGGVAIPAPNVGGVLPVDVTYLDGSAATPATGAINTNIVSVNGTTFTGPNVPGNALQWGGVTVGGMPNPTTPPTVQQIDAQLSGTHGSGGWGGSGGSATDPWATFLPGAYQAGTAGAILGNYLDAKVSTRSTYAGGPVASVSAPVTVGTNNDKLGYFLASAGLDSITIENGVNARQAISPILAASAGVLLGAGTGTVTIKGGNVNTTRITANTDNAGNRTGVTLNLPT